MTFHGPHCPKCADHHTIHMFNVYLLLSYIRSQYNCYHVPLSFRLTANSQSSQHRQIGIPTSFSGIPHPMSLVCLLLSKGCAGTLLLFLHCCLCHWQRRFKNSGDSWNIPTINRNVSSKKQKHMGTLFANGVSPCLFHASMLQVEYSTRFSDFSVDSCQ